MERKEKLTMGCSRYAKDTAKVSAPAIIATPTTPRLTNRGNGNSFERMVHAAKNKRETWMKRARTENRMRLLLRSVHFGASCKTTAVMARYAPNDVQANPHHRKNSCLYRRA